MIDSPAEFLEKVVIPNLAEFHDNPTDPRRAVNTVLSAYHLSDWVFSY